MKWFKRMDESEQYAAEKSLKIAYAYTIIFLLIWIIIEYLTTRSTSNLAFFLFITQNLVLVISQAYLKNRIGSSR